MHLSPSSRRGRLYTYLAVALLIAIGAYGYSLGRHRAALDNASAAAVR